MASIMGPEETDIVGTVTGDTVTEFGITYPDGRDGLSEIITPTGNEFPY